MTHSDPASLLPHIVALARRAGEEILQVYASDFAVSDKADRSPLTAADLRSHALIARELGALTPHIPLMSEEGSAIPFAQRRHWERHWLVDPLDGTKEFLARNGEFTVNIALIERHRPVLGVVHVPVSATTYYGTSTGGAWRSDGVEAPRRIHVQTPAPPRLRVVGSRSHATDTLTERLARLGEHELMPIGSSLKFCLVAEGRADLYPRFGPTSEWDTAAAHAVVEAAGGGVCTTTGEPLLYNVEESLLNPSFIAYGDRSRDWAALLG